MKKIVVTIIIALFLCSYANAFFDLEIGGINITKTVKSVAKASRELTEREEYYLGRGVAARILTRYPLIDDKHLLEYINLVGNTIAINSDRPYTYGGYHFAVLDSGEVNAFASPGGIIFLTEGMVNAVRDEDELAAVLAHEIAHISKRDGVTSIQQSRWTEAASIIAGQAANRYGSADLKRLVGFFEGSIDDVFKTLVLSGYNQSQEFAADESALAYLVRAGYNPGALRSILERLSSSSGSQEGRSLSTHPGMEERLEKIAGGLPHPDTKYEPVAIREERFKRAVSAVSK